MLAYNLVKIHVWLICASELYDVFKFQSVSLALVISPNEDVYTMAAGIFC